jgi:hypothetical protein
MWRYVGYPSYLAVRGSALRMLQGHTLRTPRMSWRDLGLTSLGPRYQAMDSAILSTDLHLISYPKPRVKKSIKFLTVVVVRISVPKLKVCFGTEVCLK